MSSSSSSSSSLDSTANSFTNSAWDVQKANRPVEGKPTLGMGHGIGNPDDADDGEHHRHLLKKRIYPTIFTYPTQKSTSEGPNEPVQETPLPNKKTDLEAAVLADCINSNFLFAHLEQDKQQVILEAFEKVKIRKNEIIFRQGDPADYCYMLFQGEVRIEDEHGTEVQPSGEKYEVLGELELLTASPHVNTVKATSASIIFRLGRVHFQRAISPPEVLTDSIEERIQILKRACPSELLEYLEDDETALKKLVSGMTTRTFSKGDVLYQNNGFVIISEGLAIASMEGKGYEDLSIGPGEAQTSYGWRMFASEARVERRIVASTDGKALIITKEAFANAFGNHGGAPLLQHLATKRLARIQLQQIAVFKDSELDDKQINGLLDLMHHCEYSHSVDEIIMKAGEKVEPAMYFVREGCVTLEMNRGQTKQTIAKGSFFGEKNMLLDQNKDGQKHFKIRAIMTAIAHPNTKVDILYLEECRKVVNTRLLGLGKPAPVSAIDASIQWADLRRHKMLGAGSFGQVWLASVPDQDGSDETGDKRRIVALKVQAKHQLVESSQAARVVAERNILASLHSPFIIRLYSTFQDDGLLYMITSLLQGGELESLIPQDGLSESATKFYAAGILEGLSYMHRHHIIHRDVKPGNILIDEKGYPVLIDLGFAKYVPDKTYTWCGSPLLTAPEMIRMQGHDKSADHWSWAVLVYYLATARYPFMRKTDKIDEVALYKRICKGTFEIDGTMSIQFRMLMVAVLYPDPTQRLGSAVNGWRDIFAHPWFSDDDSFNLRTLRKREMPAPWVPELKDPLDASRFYQSSDVEDLMAKHFFPEITDQQEKTFSSFGPQIVTST